MSESKPQMLSIPKKRSQPDEWLDSESSIWLQGVATLVNTVDIKPIASVSLFFAFYNKHDLTIIKEHKVENSKTL